MTFAGAKPMAAAALAVTLLAGCQQLPSHAPPIPVPPAPACTNQNLSPEALFSEARPGVVVVMHDGGTGSGFVVRHQNGTTLLLTNAHVVEGTDSVTLKWPDGSQDNAAVLRNAGGESPLSDLALLEVKAVRGKVLNLKTTKPNVGAEVVAIGAPQGLEFSLTRGVVSSLRENDALLQIDAPINPGNSGGPLIDRTGCVVGVVTLKLEDSEGLNFAVAASRIAAFLAEPGNQTPGPRVNPSPAPSGKPTCWFQLKTDAQELQGFRCSVSSRVNSNGHTVYDVVEPGGLTRTVVLWEGDTAELIMNNQVYQARWERDQAGDIMVNVDGSVFAFSIPE